MKEYVDWYVFTAPYQIKVENQKKDFTISTDYKVEHPITGDEIIIPNNYSAALRANIFQKASEALGWSKDRPLLYAWQYDLLKRMGKRTCFTHVRRAGKTIFMALAALRFLLKDNKAAALRPTSVIYLSLAEKNIQAVVHYLIKMKESFGDLGDQLFHYDSKYNVFSFKRGREVLGTITFISKYGRDPGVGNFCDALIVDEAPRIPYDVFKDFEPFITHENADFLAGSTMYEDVEKSWFFDYLVEYEKESRARYDIDKHILDRWRIKQTDPSFVPDISTGVRYTIDDDENMTDAMKEKVKADYLAKSPARYLTELYSRFPDEGKVFRYTNSLQIASVLIKPVYKYIIIGFDPALVQDKSAIEIVGYDEGTQKLVVLEEATINTGDEHTFAAQTVEIKKILKTLLTKYSIGDITNPKFFVMDTTGNQKGTAELIRMAGINIDLMIAYTAWEFIRESIIPGEIMVPKKTLVGISKILFKNSKVLINNENTELISQLDNFYQIGKDRYEWKGAHDDHVNAMMLALFFAYEHLWLKHEMMLTGPTTADPYDKKQRKLTQKQLIDFNKRKKIDPLAEKKSDDYFNKYVW